MEDAGEVTVPLNRRTVSAAVAAADAMPEGPRRAGRHERIEQIDQDATLFLHYAADPMGRQAVTATVGTNGTRAERPPRETIQTRT
jgi:hypothetical protein